MQQPPRSSSRGTFVFTAVAVVALGSTILATGLNGGAQRRLAAERAELRAECKEMRGADPCVRSTDPVLPVFLEKKERLVAVDRVLAQGERSAAAAGLAEVLVAADGLDRHNTVTASLVAGALIDEVGKRIDRDPALLDQPSLAAAVRRASYASAKHPLTTERLQAETRLSRVPSEVPLRTAGFAEAVTARAIGDVDVALRKMETAVLAKDDAACQAAATSTRGLAGQVTVGPSMCSFAARIVASGDRLAELRARAFARQQAPRTAARRL